jgi:hypothetical protein
MLVKDDKDPLQSAIAEAKKQKLIKVGEKIVTITSSAEGTA